MKFLIANSSFIYLLIYFLIYIEEQEEEEEEEEEENLSEFEKEINNNIHVWNQIEDIENQTSYNYYYKANKNKMKTFMKNKHRHFDTVCFKEPIE